MELRQYQLDFVASVLAAIEQAQHPLVVAPTGSGKTVIAAEIIRALGENKFVLVIAHRRELIRQTKKKLAEFGIKAGVILAGEPLDLTRRVQIASIQTISARYIRGGKELPPADVIFIDEAHHARARTYKKLIEMYPDARVAGLTATPCRKDGRGLGSTFSTMIETPQVQQLIDLGFLVKTRFFAPSMPDLKGVHIRQGDYVEREHAERVDLPELVGSIVVSWHQHNTERRKTVVFAVNVAHSQNLCDEFVKSGVKAEHIDGGTPKDVRDEILAKLDRGEIEVVCNCMILTEGWDQPAVSCIVLARPTKSMGLYRQMVGRGLRPAPGKTDLLVLDHSGAVYSHGRPEDPMVWFLEEDKKAKSPAQLARTLSPSANRLLACKKCSAIRVAGKPCTECGYFPKRPGEFMSTRDGELHHVDQDGNQHQNRYSEEQRREFYGGLLQLTVDRGQKPGAAAYRFKDKFGEFPPRYWGTEPASPTPEVLAWDRHCRIKYAKAMQKQKESAYA